MAEPKVRFKQDDGSCYPDIQLVPFGEVVKPFTEKTKTENEDVLLSCAINGVFLNTELFGHQRGASNKGYKKIRRNTLILSAQNLHLGNANVNQRFDHGIISPAYNTYDIVGCNPDYMAQWVKREATKKFFYDATTTGASQCRRNVDWNALYEQIFYVPCEEEQQKIADFLSSVDEVIAASEQEVANLETQKKAVIKKIFSQEVRFKREDGTDFPEWEEQSFEKTFEPLNNNTFSRDMLNFAAGPALNIHYGDVLVKYGDVCDIDKDVLPYVNEGQDVTKYAALRDGDIVLADTAEDETVGKAIEVINVQDRIVVSGLHTMACRPRIAFSLKYLGYYLNSAEFHDQLRPFIQGIKVSSIGRKNICGVLVKYPSDLEEQRLIANFLSNCDEAIAAAKKELELWKELKKGLLQQMFV